MLPPDQCFPKQEECDVMLYSVSMYSSRDANMV